MAIPLWSCCFLKIPFLSDSRTRQVCGRRCIYFPVDWFIVQNLICTAVVKICSRKYFWKLDNLWRSATHASMWRDKGKHTVECPRMSRNQAKGSATGHQPTNKCIGMRWHAKLDAIRNIELSFRFLRSNWHILASQWTIPSTTRKYNATYYQQKANNSRKHSHFVANSHTPDSREQVQSGHFDRQQKRCDGDPATLFQLQYIYYPQ